LTPNRLNGFCQPIRTCGSILNILQKPPISAQDRLFLQKSQCKADVQPWVCCASTTPASPTPITPSSGLTSNSKLPKAPQCGIDAPDRIFGGEATKIDEFPWLAQIGYEKR
jgi:Regulatory CLIP domain of proteinases